MQLYKIIAPFVWGLLVGAQLIAQGPPIVGDKPIMLGKNDWVLRTITEVRSTDKGTFTKVPFMIHYLPSSDVLLAVHIPYVDYRFDNSIAGSTLGDVEIKAKYQFLRKDQKGKTLRMVATTLQTLPSGKDLDIHNMSTGVYQSYFGAVLGYESLSLGVLTELGYTESKDSQYDELKHEFSVGLPLLKPSYPVKQINLFFETQTSWYSSVDEFMLLYSQGLQYAKGRFTLEASYQFPIIQNLNNQPSRNYSLFMGSRYIF